MSIIARLGLALGLLMLLGLLLWQGTLDVIRLLIGSGWDLLWLPLIWLPSLIPATQGWRLLFGIYTPPAFVPAFLAMWIGRAVNNLLPVASIGGEIAKARLVNIWGTDGISAAASVVVDKAAQALSIALWGMTGVGCMLFLTTDRILALYATLGFLLLSVCIFGFLVIQKMGLLGLLARLGGKLIKSGTWEGITFNAKEIDLRILDIYRHKSAIFYAVILRTTGLLLQTAEVWLACYLLGFPISLIEAVMLRSLTTTLSDIAFIIPNAYGVQEGTFIIIGALIGMPADVALAVSLAIRIHDFLFDPPALLVLHHVESKHFISRLQQARRDI